MGSYQLKKNSVQTIKKNQDSEMKMAKMKIRSVDIKTVRFNT